MPPPPVTPCPHRFIVRKEAAPVRRTPLTQSHTPRPSSSTQQFNATPRFTFSSTPRPTATQPAQAPTPGAARFFTPAPKTTAQDVIEESSDDIPFDLQQSIENDDTDINDIDDDVDLLYESAEDNEDSRLKEPTPKRRRLTSPLLLDEEDPQEERLDDYTTNDHQEDLLSSSLPSIPSPPAPRRPTSSSTHHKFILSTPAPTTPQPAHSTQTQAQTPFVKPPRFLPPDLSEASRSDPLPEHFSPNRKGHKYLPGGLASEVRDWLTNLSTAIPATRSRDDPWVVRVLVDEVNGGGRAGMTLVKGRQVQGEEVVDRLGVVRVMLAGEGMGNGLQKGAKAEAGKVVGLRGPVWDVVVEGMRWGVGVEWKLLS